LKHIPDSFLAAGVSLLDGFSAYLKPENGYWLAIVTDMPSVSVSEPTPEAAVCTLIKVWRELRSSYKADGFHPPTAENPGLMRMC